MFLKELSDSLMRATAVNAGDGYPDLTLKGPDDLLAFFDEYFLRISLLSVSGITRDAVFKQSFPAILPSNNRSMPDRNGHSLEHPHTTHLLTI
jgi:hypothetical protein